ncbi:MAG: exosortase/archaeosortase family protein [Planctomycetes bacterium]|nr:exosortase/archaeosortase family protein [Planctomycetota bacterium]
MDFSGSEPSTTFLTGEQQRSLNKEETQSAWLVFGGLVLLLTYGYLNMLSYTSMSWKDPLYSHGYIVPLFAGFLFWVRRRPLTVVEPGERWIGLGILLISLAVRLGASYVDMNPLDRLSYLGALLGVCQMVGGTSMLKWAGPAVGFLVFMYPLPSVLEHSVLLFLQKLAAIASTWVLQLLGAPALRDGNRIMIDQLPLEVADACSGLRMSTIFGAMSVAMAILIIRPWWDRVTILLSAIPIALVTNVIRITLTALLFMAFPDSELVHQLVHDWAGLAMMPIAMGLLWIELQLLEQITVPIESDDYAAFGAAYG